MPVLLAASCSVLFERGELLAGAYERVCQTYAEGRRRRFERRRTRTSSRSLFAGFGGRNLDDHSLHGTQSPITVSGSRTLIYVLSLRNHAADARSIARAGKAFCRRAAARARALALKGVVVALERWMRSGGTTSRPHRMLPQRQIAHDVPAARQRFLACRHVFDGCAYDRLDDCTTTTFELVGSKRAVDVPAPLLGSPPRTRDAFIPCIRRANAPPRATSTRACPGRHQVTNRSG